MTYKNFKRILLKQLEIERDLIIAQNSINRPESLFQIASADDKKYIKILQTFERIAVRNVEKLVQDLCASYNIKCDTECEWDMHISIDESSFFVEFRSSPYMFNSASIQHFVSNVKHCGSPVYLVFLLKDGINTRESLSRFRKTIQRIDSSVQINIIIFDDLIKMLFGDDEQYKFEHSMKTFNDEMHQVIGYQITEICSSTNKQKFKSQLHKELRDFDYRSVKAMHYEAAIHTTGTPLNLYDSVFDKILNHYLSNELYELLLGSEDFASSFFTSEWLFKKYCSTPELDNTFIVAGYLKSIEQLLWDIIRVVGQGRTIHNITVSEENYDIIDNTLGSLEFFLRCEDNFDLFRNAFGNSQFFVIRYLKSQIADWRTHYRNGLFHKDQLNSEEIITRIRQETIYLYMLILGSIELSEASINRLKS